LYTAFLEQSKHTFPPDLSHEPYQAISGILDFCDTCKDFCKDFTCLAYYPFYVEYLSALQKYEADKPEVCLAFGRKCGRNDGV